MGKHNEFGKQGEDVAVRFLEKQQYAILARNYRYLKAEVDIIAQKGGVLAIVEVKSRNSDFLEDLTAVIGRKKIELLIAAANQYVLEYDLEVDIRFDLITVIRRNGKFELEHLEDAFYHF